jgi:hypothetical protein
MSQAMRDSEPDEIKITPAEAAQLLRARVEKLHRLGIGDALKAAQVLWPRLFAWSSGEKQGANQ